MVLRFYHELKSCMKMSNNLSQESIRFHCAITYIESIFVALPFADEKIEAELIGFEKLLNEVMVFKSNSSIWSRNERLSYTQNFAEAFDNLIGEGSSDEEATWSKTKPD